MDTVSWDRLERDGYFVEDSCLDFDTIARLNLAFNGHLWHSGRRNDGAGTRRAVQMTARNGRATTREE